MFSRIFPSVLKGAARSSNKKVTVLGASGGIGQPLSLLLKLNPKISQLSLYDIEKAASPCKGVAADVSHINRPAQVCGHAGDAELPAALRESDLVVMTAGVPRKPGMSRDDLFNVNAGIVKGLAEQCALHCPQAVLLIVSNPVNSTVPVASEVYKEKGCYDWKKIIGVTTLDCIRANAFLAEHSGLTEVSVPVVGGHAGASILPILSQTQPSVKLTPDETCALDKRIQDAGTEVVNAKQGTGSATLSMAFAASHFIDLVLKGFEGEVNEACGYVGNQPETGYFSWPLELAEGGVNRVLPLTQFTSYEEKRLEEVKAQLLTEVKKGEDFAHRH